MATTSTIRPDRVHLEQCGVCHAPTGQPCSIDGEHAGRRWDIGLTAPRHAGSGPLGASLLVPDGGRCRPTIEDTYWWDHTTRDQRFPKESVRVAIVYRGACLGCGWAGPTRVDENDAVEDAHDHAWPGWRHLPIVNQPPHDAKPKDIVRWRHRISQLYRAVGLDVDHWTQPDAPFRTARQPRGTRSHSTHHAGYDICGTITNPGTRPAPTSHRRLDPQEQLALW